MLEDYRKLVGQVKTEGTPLRPRTELVLAAEKYKAYRVILDVTVGVSVYGNLLVPNNVKGRAPAVICQHGLNGTPEMITGLGQKEDTPYHEFGRRLAERGYVVFAPLLLHHHPWINRQVRQADAVGMMRVSMPVAKTQRVVDFLQSLPFVAPERIGYYGLSYGGYSALWIPPLVDRLAAVVVSGHFNDWRSKITSDATPTSYLLHPDEDFYNWDILHRFTHPELVMMTSPRAVCIEFGLRDGITTPEWTAYAWKQLATTGDRVGLTNRIVLAQFDGVHEVHGVESFQFLDRFLRK
jgi:dienelactone hydrolase